MRGNACWCIFTRLLFIYIPGGAEGVTGREAENSNAASGDLNRNGGLLTSEDHLMDFCRVCVFVCSLSLCRPVEKTDEGLQHPDPYGRLKGRIHSK